MIFSDPLKSIEMVEHVTTLLQVSTELPNLRKPFQVGKEETNRTSEE
jgi:hypothetical protein